jgi:AGCS family alanine or glycine:cation symporter
MACTAKSPYTKNHVERRKVMEFLQVEFVQKIVDAANDILWGPAMLTLLVGTHIFLTFRTKFIQAHVFKGIKLTFAKDPNAKGDVTQWGALAVALSATLGTGNIVGVATAVVRGGPGAVFWLWITGVFGIATKYGEALLAVKYRVKTSDGTMLGGPMYAIERGMKSKLLAILFSIFTVVACFGIGNMVQSNSITANFHGTLGIPPMASGIFLSALTLLVIVGGIRSIARVAETVIPFMAVVFFGCCFGVLMMNYMYIIPAITLIFKSAFSQQAIEGGLLGYAVQQAIRFGIARGLFSNEAGLGSSPIAAAAATSSNPVRQALVSMSQVFWDTIILCFTTGTMYVSCILRHPDKFIDPSTNTLISGARFAAVAFESIPVVGPYLLTLCIFLFAWTTIIGWEYYGERCIEHLGGKKMLLPFRLFYGFIVFVGAVTALNLVWDIADAFNALMAIPNLISLIALNGIIVAVTREYLWNNNLDGLDPEPILEIKN